MTGRSEQQLASEAIGWMLANLRDDREGSIAMAEAMTKREATIGLFVAVRFALDRLEADAVPSTLVMQRVRAAMHGLAESLGPGDEPAYEQGLRIIDTIAAARRSKSPLAEHELGDKPQVALLLVLAALCEVLGEAYKMTAYEAGQALAKTVATARRSE